MELGLGKSRKGMLLTLVTLVLVVLMLGEVISYIYAGITYNNIQTFSNPAAASSALQWAVQGSYSSILHQSMRSAITALAAYESSNQINGPINSTGFALQSLMTNGTVYGANMTGYMGNTTMLAYNSLVHSEGLQQDLNASITNGTVTVYQTSPFAINATYSGLLTINSGSSSLSYQIYANTSLLLNGTTDLYGSITGSPQILRETNPGNTFIIPNVTLGPIYSIGGSKSPFLFAFAPLFQFSGTPTCTQIWTGTGGESILPQNVIGHYIIYTPYTLDLPGNLCGAEGALTYFPNTTGPPLKPFLIYSQPSCYSHCTLDQLVRYGGPIVLLNGGTVGLFDFRNVTLAIGNGYYIPSGYSPSYLDLAGGSYKSYSPYGIAPLGALNRDVLELTGTNNVILSNVPINTVTGAHTSISFWVRWPSAFSADTDPIAFSNGNGIYISQNSIGFGGNGGIILGINTTDTEVFSHSPYVHVVAVFDNNNILAANNGISLYLDGVRQTLSVPGATFNGITAVTNTIYIGGSYFSSGLWTPFTGQIANLQVYNNALTPYQAEELYLNGINGQPINYTMLAGWWPLNGNAYDYSKYHNNGTVGTLLTTAASFQRINDYIGDTFDGGSFYKGITERLEGFTRCFNINNCNWTNSAIVYLPAQRTYSPTGVWSSGGAESIFELQNATIPDTAYFDSAQNVSFLANGLTYGSGWNTVSFWMFIQPQASGYETPIWLSNFGLQSSNSGNTFGIASSTDGLCSISLGNVVNSWVNVVMQFQVGTALDTSLLFVNGTQQTGLPAGCGGGLITTPNSIRIGAQSGADAPFSGAIEDVQVYNTQLTSGQIWTLFENNSVNSVSPATPIASWPLDGGYNGFLNESQDLVGNSIAYVYKSGGVLQGGTSSTSGVLNGGPVICTNANETDAIGYQCGVLYLPHEIPENYKSNPPPVFK